MTDLKNSKFYELCSTRTWRIGGWKEIGSGWHTGLRTVIKSVGGGGGEGGGWRGPGVGALSRSHRAVNHPGDRRRRINLGNSQLTARLRLRSNGHSSAASSTTFSFRIFLITHHHDIPRKEINRRRQVYIYSLVKTNCFICVSIHVFHWRKLIQKRVDFFRNKGFRSDSSILLLFFEDYRVGKNGRCWGGAKFEQRTSKGEPVETGTIRWNKKKEKERE